MEYELIRVSKIDQIRETANLADEIWNECYGSILGKNQIAYMLEHFQSEEALCRQIAEGYLYYILSADGRSAGYVCVRIEGERLFLSKLYICGAFRRLGLARRTIEELKAFAVENDLHEIYLTVNKKNTPAVLSYERLGFQRTDSSKAEIGGGFVMDDYIYSLAL